MSSVSEDDAFNALTVRLSETGIAWDASRWKGFLQLSPEEQLLAVQMLEDAAVPPSRDAWADALRILQEVGVVVGVVAGIATGIGGVAGAIGAVQSTVKGL